jgi:hypothetical protein
MSRTCRYPVTTGNYRDDPLQPKPQPGGEIHEASSSRFDLPPAPLPGRPDLALRRGRGSGFAPVWGARAAHEGVSLALRLGFGPAMRAGQGASPRVSETGLSRVYARVCFGSPPWERRIGAL